MSSYADGYYCHNDEYAFLTTNNTTGLCPCDPNDANYLATRPDGALVPPPANQCPASCTGDSIDPEACDGLELAASGPFDEGCGDDEHKCTSSRGMDPFPVFLSSGRVETNEIVAFEAPAPADAFFGFRLKWHSHINQHPAGIFTGDSEPTPHNSEQVTHFLGLGWIDNFSDRLMISMRGIPSDGTVITWTSMRGIVTFRKVNGLWRSTSGKYELVDRGNPAPDIHGRWMVRTLDPHAVRRIWTFEEVSYTNYLGVPETSGRLRRHALTNGNDVNGFYSINVVWDGWTIASVTDSLQRSLEFAYEEFGNCDETPALVCTRALANVSYRPHPDHAAVSVVNLRYTHVGSLLDMVERVGHVSYTRFLYLQDTTNCHNCSGVLTDVVIPRQVLATPLPNAPISVNEVAVEHHDYTTFLTGKRPLVRRSSGVSREYGYVWDEDNRKAIQYDLHQPKGTCDSLGGCPQGQACWIDDSSCYVATEMSWSSDFRLPQGNLPAGQATSSASGNFSHGILSYSSGSVPAAITDNGGTQILNDYDVFGRLRCLIRGASSADLVNCTAASTAQVIKVEYLSSAPGCVGKAIVKTIPSTVVAGQVMTTTECLNSNLQVIQVREAGTTRDLNGSAVQEVHVSTTTYDANGRVVVKNGPRDDSEGMDRTTFSYWVHTPANPNSDLNFGRLRYVTRSVGVTGSATSQTTTYDQYDVWGVPHLITNPDGSRRVYEASSDRLTWTTRFQAPGGATIMTTTTVLNADGTVRSQQDGDGACVTYQYTDSNGKFLGSPTKIRRSNAGCGILPIDENSGDVEVRTYEQGEGERLSSVVRKRAGVVEFSISGFQYDENRRIASRATLDSSLPVTFEYTDVLQTGVRDPGGPAPGAGYSQTLVDNYGRPSAIARSLGSSASTVSFGYSSPFSGRPTTVVRGQPGSGSTSTFEYDDFGRIITSVIPESGPPGSPSAARFLYDAAGNMIKSRFGVGTPDVRTSQYTYDSLGRVTYVDHDLEHPVDCATAPAETPIQDEEYKYDTCADLPPNMFCANPLGKLTSARVLSQCGTSGEVVRIGRWYMYDSIGRRTSTGYATKTGTIIGTAAVTTTSYTPGGRVAQTGSPLNSVFGSSYVYDAMGDVQELKTSWGSPIATRILGWTTGGWRSFNTPIVQNNSSGNPRSLRHRNRRRPDGRLDAMTLLLTDQDPVEIGSPSLGTTSVNLLTQIFTFSPGGALQTRTDHADGVSSRFYGYDALMRLTCEVRGVAFPPGQTPSSTSCNVASPSLASLITYSDGANLEPTDVRRTAFVKSMNSSGFPCSDQNPCYASVAPETGIYQAQSTQIQRLRREPTGTRDLVLGYDQVGRRVFDYEAHDPVESRRDYSYLPNGQLGKITGRRFGHPTYQSFRYDERGRPIRISTDGDYELFYDDADRLIAVYITSNASKTVDSTRWHYHYMGDTVVAATREVILSAQQGGTNVKRFWFVQDERGLVHRLLDEQGATYWQARWDASGWRTLVGTPQPNMWVPFGLPGQIILDGTQAFAKDSPTSSSGQTRPAIALNQHRSYDPLIASFMQVEPLDVIGQVLPSGYSYARHSPVMFVDPDGMEVMPVPFIYAIRKHKGCSLAQRVAIANAIISASRDFAKCVNGLCDSFGGENLKRWVNFWLGRADIGCVSESIGITQTRLVMDGRLVSTKGPALGMSDVDEMELAPDNFRDPTRSWISRRETRRVINRGGSAIPDCLARTLVHEALHMALRQTGPGNSAYPPLPYLARPSSDSESSWMWAHSRLDMMFRTKYGAHEIYVETLTQGCVDCKTN